MYLAKLFDEAHFATNGEDEQTVCGEQIHDDFLVKDSSPRNAVYYIEKFEPSDEMDVCAECQEYVQKNHGLSEEEYAKLAKKASNH